MGHTFRRSLKLLASISSSAALCTPIQVNGQTVYRSAVTYVEIPVRVIDDRGLFVRDLEKSEVSVFEDGAKQIISTFALVDVQSTPFTNLPSARTGRLAEATNPARVYVFVLDDYFLPFAYTSQVKRIVRLFIDNDLKDRDTVALIFTSGVTGTDFTSDRTELLRSVDLFIGKWNPRDVPSLHEVQAMSVWRTMRELAVRLAVFPGRRKAVFFVSQDIACNLFGMSSCGQVFREAIRSAQQADVSFYPVDPRGLLPANSPDISLGADSSFHVRPSPPNRTLGAFGTLSADTGGFVIADSNRFRDMFERVARENGLYYLIGYSSDNHNEKRIHRNVITINRKGLHATYRPAYYGRSGP
jgi:VWFA-related protein